MLCAVLCTVLWGSAYPVIKYGYERLGILSVPDQLAFAGVHFAAAGMMVFAAAWIRRGRAPFVPRDKIGGVALYGVLQTGLMYLCNYIGVANTTATKTSVLTAASAFFAVVFAPLFFKEERLTVVRLAGVIIGLLGVAAVNTGGLGGFSLQGEGMVLLSALLNTAGSFAGKRVSKGMVLESTAWQLMIGAALLLLVALPLGGSMAISVQGVLVVLYLAFVSAAAFVLWAALLVRHDAGRILVFNMLIPVTGAAWSYIILGERQILQPMYVLSVILISAGILLVNCQEKVKKPL